MGSWDNLGTALAGSLNDGTSVYKNAGKDGFLDQVQNYLNGATATISTGDVILQAMGRELPIGFAVAAFQANLLKTSVAIGQLADAINKYQNGEGGVAEITAATLGIIGGVAGVVGALPPGAVTPEVSIIANLASIAATLGSDYLGDPAHAKEFNDLLSTIGDALANPPSLLEMSSFIENSLLGPLSDELKNMYLDFTHKAPSCDAVRPWTLKVEQVPDPDGDPNDGDELAEGETPRRYTYLVPPTDPLILDLNSNGIATVGLNAGIQFDQISSGTKQGTGWIAPGNGFLVLDRNGNGVIDNGTELFGNNTPLYDAVGNITSYAADGQSALAALDTNHDGVVNNLDANFTNLKVWQDTNQDGISQSGELQTLDQLGIASLNVGMVATDPISNGSTLPNGNQLSATGTFTRTDGTTGVTADVNLALDPLARSFSDSILVTADAQALPTMQGSGTVRNLNEAASMQTSEGTALVAAITAFNTATTGFAQHAEVDTVLQDWAATSAQQTSIRQAAAQGRTLHYYTPTATGIIDPVESAGITEMISVMECFGGVNFTPFNGVPSGTGDIYVPLADFESTSFQQRYYALQDSIYGALAMQTRLYPYLDSISLNFTTGTGLQYDFTVLNTRIADKQTSDPKGALIDLVELQRFAGEKLKTMGWDAMPLIADSLHTLQGTPQFTEAMDLFRSYSLSDWTRNHGLEVSLNSGSGSDGGNYLVFGEAGIDYMSGSYGSDILVSASESGSNTTNIRAGTGKEYIIGGNGNDTIFGGEGGNTIYSGDGNATIQLAGGVSETSTVYGGAGSDTINGGAGIDVIYTGDGGITSAATMAYAGIGTSTIYGGAGVDQIYGGSGSDTLFAGTGTSTLTGGTGAEVMYSSTGNAILIAGTGNDTLYGGSGTDLLQGNNKIYSQTMFVAGSGNETIIGGGGSNSYEFDAGFGKVELQNIQSNDTFRFGKGISVSDLTLSATIGSDGNPALLVHYSGGGQIIVDGGLDGTISQFVFDNGVLSLDQLMAQSSTTPVTVADAKRNLIFSANGNETLVGGAGIDSIYAWNGNDTFIVNNSADVVHAHLQGNTIESSVSYSLANNAQAVQNLTFTGAADLAAIGNSLDNVITANSGNDTLIGGAGNDTLIGGAGLDTFGMGAGMGLDTIIATSPQGGIVQLDTGLSLSNLTAMQQGNDLQLQIVGSTDGMLIKDYYSNPQSVWSVKDDSGNIASLQNLLDATAALPISLGMSQIESDFMERAKEDIIQGLNGYSQQTNGSYLYVNNPNYYQYQLRVLLTNGADLNVQHNISYLDGSVATYNNQESWIQSVIQIPVGTSIAIQKTKNSFSSPVINANSTLSTNTYDVKWAKYKLDYSYNWPSTNTYTVPVTDSHGNVIGLDQQVIALTPNAWELHESIDGAIFSGTVGVGPVTQTIPLYVVQQNITDVIQQMYIGDGNHTVNGGQWSVVNGGAGNDVINNAGFVYTGRGNDTVIGAGTVYGGSGNNKIINAGTVYGGTGNNEIVNAVNAYGGSGNDTMIGGGTMTAGSGNDFLIGGNTMIAGTGNDQIFAGQGATTIQIDPTTAGTDLIGGAGGDSVQFLNAFYQSMGVNDWQVHYQNAGSYLYYLNTEAGSGYFDGQTVVNKLNGWGWGDMTIQQAIDYGYATYTYIEPLDVLAVVHDGSIHASDYYATSDVPVVNFSANDFKLLSTYYDQGILASHNIEFGAGILPSDLHLSWGETLGSITGLATDQQLKYTTLTISWGTNNQSIQVMIPHSDDPLGSGASQFSFADGTVLTMADMIDMAPVASTFDPQIFHYQPGMGVQIMGAGYNSINFGPGITSSMITLGLGSLMLRVGNSGDVIHIENFNPNEALAANSIRHFNFADGTTLSYEQLLSRGFDIYGTTGDEVLSGTNLDNRIYAGTGNDTLIGTGANDTLIAGAGIDTLIGGTGNETFVINNAADVIIANANAASNTVKSSVDYVLPESFNNLTLTGNGNLTATGNNLDNILTSNTGIDTLIGGAGNETFIVNNSADVIIANPNAASNTVLSSVDFVLPEDLNNLTLIGSANLIATGNRYDDILTGNAGYDTLIASSGDDTLVSGTGGGIMIAGIGNDTFVLNANSGQQTIIDTNKATGNTISFGSGISARDVVFLQQGADMLVTYAANGSVLIKNYDLFSTDTPPLISAWQFADGSYITITCGNNYDGPGSYDISQYDVLGNQIGDQWAYNDGTHGTVIRGLDGSMSNSSYGADGRHTQVVDDGKGNYSESNFNASGSLASDTWQHADGSNGTDTYNADGSSTGTTHFVNGSYSATTNDGHGDVSTIQYQSNGVKSGDSWSRADGSYGSGTFNPNGSGNGEAHYADGSYDTIYYINNVTSFENRYDASSAYIGYGYYYDYGHNNTQQQIFDSTGRMISNSWAGGDSNGTSWTEIYNIDGTHIRTDNNGLGLVTTTDFDINGIKVSSSWTTSDGSSGSDIFNVDGSYIDIVNDGHGKVITTNYDTSGNKLNDSWAKIGGSNGSDTFNTDGSSSGIAQYVDGGYSTYTNDGLGNISTLNFGVNGTQLGMSESSVDAWGTIYMINYDANGFKLSDSYVTSYGATNTYYYDATGRVISDTWQISDSSHGTDTFNIDGSTSGNGYNANGSYYNYVKNGQGTFNELDYASNGTLTGDYWERPDGFYGNDTFNIDGSSSGAIYNDNDGSHSTYTNDGLGNVTTTNFDPNGNELGYNIAINNDHGVVTTTQYDINSSVLGSSITFNDGLGNTTTATFDASGTKLDDTWTKAEGSHGSDIFNADGSSTGTSYNAEGSYRSYSNDGLGNNTTQFNNESGRLIGDQWVHADGSSGTDVIDPVSGIKVSGMTNNPVKGYTDTYTRTQLDNGSLETILNYTYTDGSTYITDTVKVADGSYQQCWSRSDGSSGTTNYIAQTGEKSGTIINAAKGYSEVFDNTVLANGSTEAVLAYTYTDGSTYTTDTVKAADGSYQQSWSWSAGSSGTTNYNAATAEKSGTIINPVKGYSEVFDTSVLVDGLTEAVLAYTYTDGSTYTTNTVKTIDGSYVQTWSRSDGSSGTTNFTASTGEKTGTISNPAKDYSEVFDNTALVDGSTEAKLAYTYTDGSIYTTDTVKAADGSYQQRWSRSDGSSGTTNYIALTGEKSGTTLNPAKGYSEVFDNTVLANGSIGAKLAYTYTDGSTYITDTVKAIDGSYQQTWSKSLDGSSGTTNYSALTGEKSGTANYPAKGYSETFDDTILSNGSTEAVINYCYTNGSTYTTDTIKAIDGSYTQVWNKSDGTSGTKVVDSTGVLIADSWVHADGSQGADAAGNHLVLGTAAANSIKALATGNEIMIGGSGSDTITTGPNTSLIAFDKGDGKDKVYASAGVNNVLSLGGNLAYADLTLQKSSTDLILNVSATDSITFKGWYAGNKNIVDLQVVASAMSDFNPCSTDVLRNSKVEEFDFQKLVASFDTALASTPGLTTWGVTNALLDAHLLSSDTAALGGDLAYTYGTNGNLTGMGVSAAEGTLSNNQFATAPQTLNPWPTLNTGTVQIQ